MDDLKELNKLYNDAVNGQYCRGDGARFDSIIDRLEAREAEAPKDVQKLTVRINGILKDSSLDFVCAFDDTAAEIERYVQSRIAAEPKTIDYKAMALLVAASRTAMDHECYFCESDAISILKANGYEVTE